ncbi:MAG: thioredoxin family protein [Acidobacteria bacterium]|nr:thioredoxin family protein [Acidobacteriota bacterium]MCH8986391.1 thioredoxin family protein [Acidobacteriota bacterium]
MTDHTTTEVTLQYFDGCPNWKDTDAYLTALHDEGLGITVSLELVDTQEKAESANFRGSPTVLINGVDPFADPDAPVGLSCRMYPSDDGYVGSPTLEQLRSALVAARV